MPGAAVVVPLHNRSERIERLTSALEAQTCRPSEVVFVDDESTDDTLEVVRRVQRTTSLNLSCIALERNVGPAAARNVGWRATNAAYVAFTDDDCVPEPGWLAAGVGALEAHPKIGIVQGPTLRADAPRMRWEATRDVTIASPYFEAANLFARREALDASGGFGEVLRMGFEDTWLGWAVLAEGWDRGFAPEARVVHDVTYPGFRWHVREAWLFGNIVPVAKAFPGLRETFAQPWLVQSAHLGLAAAVVGVVASAVARRPAPAAVGLATYAAQNFWQARTRRPTTEWLRGRAGIAVLDAVRFASVVRQAARHRVFVL